MFTVFAIFVMIVDGTATLESLVHEYVEEHKPELGYLKTKKLQLSAYVDRQLKHLVIEENFDFEAISDLLSKTCSTQDACSRRTIISCREYTARRDGLRST